MLCNEYLLIYLLIYLGQQFIAKMCSSQVLLDALSNGNIPD